jgi:hypothetical protein
MTFLQKGLLLVLLLTGCVSHPEDKQTLSISQRTRLNPATAWPLRGEGVYLQKITANVRGETHTFSVHLTLEDYKLEAIAFNDIYGRLYHLTWTPEKINWVASDTLSEVLQPEYVIADFLLVHLPLEHLQDSLINTEIQEEKEGDESVRLITFKSELLRRISRNESLGYLWERVRIENPEVGYELDIQTVALP